MYFEDIVIAKTLFFMCIYTDTLIKIVKLEKMHAGLMRGGEYSSELLYEALMAASLKREGLPTKCNQSRLFILFSVCPFKRKASECFDDHFLSEEQKSWESFPFVAFWRVNSCMVNLIWSGGDARLCQETYFININTKIWYVRH